MARGENPKWVFAFTIPVVKRGKKKQFERLKNLYDEHPIGYIVCSREKPSPKDIEEWEVRKKMGQNPKNPYDHYHILIQLTEKKRRSQVQEWLGGKYHEVGKIWDIEKMSHYVKKGGLCGNPDCDHTWSRHGDKKCHEFANEKIKSYYFEFGRMVKERSNSRKMLELIEVMENCRTWKEVIHEADPQTLKGCMTYAKEFFYSKQKQPMEMEFRGWQKEIHDLIMEEPDDRTIYWVTDQKGGTGKSKLAKYLVRNYNAIMMNGDKADDMLYAYAGEDIIIVNLPRGGFVNFTALEQLKDGLYFAGKYQSKSVDRDYDVQVIVFSNDFPYWDGMSHDRWTAFVLAEGQSPEEQYYLRTVWNTGIPDLKVLEEYASQQEWVEHYRNKQEKKQAKKEENEWFDNWQNDASKDLGRLV